MSYQSQSWNQKQSGKVPKIEVTFLVVNPVVFVSEKMPVPTRGPLAVADRYRLFRQNAVLIVLEGNIGAGKTTLLTILKDHFHVIQREFPDHNLELETMTEPIGEWVDGDGNKLLEVQNHFISDYNKD